MGYNIDVVVITPGLNGAPKKTGFNGLSKTQFDDLLKKLAKKYVRFNVDASIDFEEITAPENVRSKIF